MSTIRPSSLTDWFHHGRRTTAPAPSARQAALKRLIRLLAGDGRRPPPPVTLAGRPTSNGYANQAAPPVPPRWKPDSKWDHGPGRPAHVSPAREPSHSDGDPPYSREELERMNERFAQRLERAFARGKERRTAASAMYWN